MRKTIMGNIRKILYKGTKAKTLETGNYYTYGEFAKEAGVGYRCMNSRLSGKRYVTDAELVPLNAHKIPKRWRNMPDLTQSRFEHPMEAISDKYLRMKL